jgi:hypothetical protein
MQDEHLRKIVNHIFNAHPEGIITCEECDRQLHCLAEKVAAGASMSDLWPEVEAHLECCAECEEVFRALVFILRGETSGALYAIDN